MTRGIAILGSTGSIGRQTLEVIRAFPDRFHVISLAAARNIDLLEEQARQFHPRVVSVRDETAARDLAERLAHLNIQVIPGQEGLVTASVQPEADLVLVAVSGLTGLVPTLEAIRAGKTIATANKEALVAGGALVTSAARKAQARILPVDSEHSAIWQCIEGKKAFVERLILTASGGPFRDMSAKELDSVTADMALKHPKWVMGPKITVDSATMMNKGLEIIEARWLFGVSYDQIQVAVHPQSIVHSLVAFYDGSVMAQMSLPDMRLPIQYALTWPERWQNQLPRLNLSDIGNLSFSGPDSERFPCLELACQAGRRGGTYPVVLNSANEVAVELFLQGKIRFPDIFRVVAEALEHMGSLADPDLDGILEVDRDTQGWVRHLCNSRL